METLVVVLWLVYLSECAATVRPGEWVFKGGTRGSLRGTAEPDVLLLAERIAVAWLPPIPWHVAWRCGGTSLDASLAASRLRSIEAAVRPLRMAAGALFVLLLPGLSLLVWTERTAPLFASWAAAALVAWIACAWLFFRTYRRVHGRRPPLEVALANVLSPLGLARSAVSIPWSAPLPFHPLAVAATTCGDEEFLRIARASCYDEPGARQTIEALASARGVEARLHAQPDPGDPSLTRYCPRCHATYRRQAARCADCTGVALRELG